MAYEPTVWNCGDTITAEKLNKLENGLADCCGSGGDTLVFSATEEEATTEECLNSGTKYTYSHSWQEIYDALAQGRIPVCVKRKTEDEVTVDTLVSAYIDSNEYYAEIATGTIYSFADATSKVYIDCDGK